MQIRYQNVQKNITYMSVSFAFMKKVLESAHPSFSSFDTTMNSELKKIQKNMVAKNNKCSKCLPSFIRKRHSWKSWQKNNLFWSADCFSCHGTHECYSLMKLGRHLKHLSFFATNIFSIF